MGVTDSKKLLDFLECPEMPESPVEWKRHQRLYILRYRQHLWDY